MRTRKVTRRGFLRQAAAGALGGQLASSGPLAAAPAMARSRHASERLGLGFIGVGGRGTHLLEVFQRFGDVDVVGVCDVKVSARERAKKAAGGAVEAFSDFRELLERRDVDAVVIATNGHWHCLPAIHACAAGKDVYVEKPLSLCPREGREVVEAARRHDRIVAIGTQQRSMTHYAEAVEHVREGKLGKVVLAETFNLEHAEPSRFGSPPDGDPPADIDWDLWLGPAPQVPYNPARVAGHYFFWDYGGGWQSDWAVHLNDVVHWAMGVDTPLSVSASGGKYHVTDCTEAPDTLEVTFEYPGFLLAYRLRWHNTQSLHGMTYGNIFYGTEGTMFLDRSGWRVYRDKESVPCVQRPGSPGDGPHQRNFVDCVRSRKSPVAEIETGHRSSVPGEIANIAFRLGRKLRWDGEREEFTGDVEANRWLLRPFRSPWTMQL
jgi:predicted dehydrogenase